MSVNYSEILTTTIQSTVTIPTTTKTPQMTTVSMYLTILPLCRPLVIPVTHWAPCGPVE